MLTSDFNSSSSSRASPGCDWVFPWTQPVGGRGPSATGDGLVSGGGGVPCAHRPGASVVLAEVPGAPIMTVLRHGVWGLRNWYVVAWLDHLGHRQESFFPEDRLAPVGDETMAS